MATGAVFWPEGADPLPETAVVSDPGAWPGSRESSENNLFIKEHPEEKLIMIDCSQQ